MKLSIILPVYNAEKYLSNCLDSLLNQTFKDFEIILINDGSEDNSRNICKLYADKDQRIVHINQENQGVAMTRNLGLKMSKGDYIGFVDADDFLDKDMFENILKPTFNYPIDIVISHFKVWNNGKYEIPGTDIPTKRLLDETAIKHHLLQCFYTGSDPLIPSLWNKIYKSDYLKQNNHQFQNQKGIRASDYWFNFEIFKTAKSAYVTEEANYNYNNVISNSIINSFRENQFESFLEGHKKLMDANEYLNFKIDLSKYFKPLNNNTNQFILSAIEAKGFFKAYGFVKNIMRNEIFRTSFNQVNINRPHVKVISFFIKNKMIFLAYLGYSLWYIKAFVSSKIIKSKML
ncbi:glycosyltransferase [Gaetbulibacter aestuarii]|uniref:Glycosyltransferase n=1 Tax=Gaetbulibacter aestuarii TaxID=1502358 RepID=A0ABW7N0W1_9FLAO